MPAAQSLFDAIDTLTIGPLDESQEDWYVGHRTGPAGREVGPLAMLRASLLKARDSERLFLSGHVGAGKSTELARLLRDPDIQGKYLVVKFAIAEAEISELSASHLLFIIAVELYTQAREQNLLGNRRNRKRWEEILQRLDDKFFGKTGVNATEGALEVKFNLVLFELRQQLKLQEGRRKEFRAFAETEPKILIDLINALADDVTLAVIEANRAQRVLIVIDDIDKLRSSHQIEEIFQKNLAALRAPELPILMTLPATVTFGGPTTELGANVTHLRPVQVLRKVEAADPLVAIDRDAIPYMQTVLDRRVRRGLFEEAVVEKAAVYSGGVFRRFFELLRNAAMRAHFLYKRETVDEVTFNDQLEEEKNNLARGTFPGDRATLAEIHKRHEMPNREALRLMNASLIIEYNHAGIWWEANPLLWHVLT